MGVLSNPRHELFAQALAEGKTQRAAYEDAGFAPSDQHASRLASSGKVSARVMELQSALATRIEITQSHVIAELFGLAQSAKTMTETYGPSAITAAKSCYMDGAKLSGWVVERSENSVNLNVCRSLLELAGD